MRAVFEDLSACLGAAPAVAFAQLSTGGVALAFLMVTASVALLILWRARGLELAALGETFQGGVAKQLLGSSTRSQSAREVDVQLRRLARSIRSHGDSSMGRQRLARYLVLNASSQDCAPFIDALSCSWERSEGSSPVQGNSQRQTRSALRWWRNQETAFLLPCTSYLEDGSTHSESARVLARILRHHGQGSLDGLVLFISVRDLDSSREYALRERAQHLRHLVQLCQHKGTDAPPIHIFIAEVDHLEGFDAFAQSLPQEERGRVWGSYIKAPAAGESWARPGGEAFEEIHNALRQHCQQALLQDRAAQDCSSLYRFTQRIQQLQTPLQHFLDAVFNPSPPSFPLRQIFLVGSAAGACNFAPNILPQGHLRKTHQPSARALQRKRQLGWVGLGLGILLSLLTWTLPYLSARENREMQAEFRALTLDARAKGNAQAPEALLRASARLHRKLDGLQQSPGLRYGLGMNQSPALLAPARFLFVRLMHQGPLAPFLREAPTQIETLVRQESPLSDSQRAELRSKLIPYLVLSKFQQDSSIAELSIYGAKLQKTILEGLRDDGSSKARIESQRIAEQYLQAIATDPSLRMPQNEELVLRAQTRLFNAESLKTRVDALLSSFRDKGPAIDSVSIGVQPIAGVPAPSVGFGYTRDGYEASIRPALKRLATTIAQEARLFSPPKSAADWELRLTHVYLEQYRARWQAFVQAIRFPLPVSAQALPLEQDRAALQFGQVYQSLANTLQHNTQWIPKVLQGEGSSAMANHFLALIRFAQPQGADSDANSSELDRYLNLLRALHSSPLGASKAQVDRLRSQAKAIAQRQRAPWRGWFIRHLDAPFDQHRQSLSRRQQEDAQATWCALVKRIKHELFQYYPFSAQAPKGSDIEALSTLLHPSEGLLWKEVDAHFGSWIARRGPRFVATPSAKPSLHPRVLGFLNAAWRLSQSLFPGAATGPKLELEIEVKPQSQVHRSRFEWGHQRYIYSNGPERARRLRWPAASKRPVALFEARHSQGSLHRFFQGPWALFRLLESGKPQREAQGSYFLLRWQSSDKRGPELSLRLRPIAKQGAWGRAKSGSLMQIFRNRALTHPPAQFFHHSPPCPTSPPHSP